MRTLLVVGLVCGAGLAVTPAAAQEPPAEDAAAKERALQFIAAGDALMEKGDALTRRRKADKAREQYEKALEAYSRAYDTFPSAKLYWLIGRAEQKLDRHLDALRHFQQVLREESDIKPELKQAIEAAIEDSKSSVVTIHFKVEPPGARIAVDGEDVGTAPLDEPVFLAPGKHTIAVTAEGHSPYEDEVELEAGQESERTIALEKIPVLVTKPKPKPKKKGASEVSRGPLVAGMVATGGLATIATITGLLAVSRHGTFSDDSLPASERDAAKSSGKTLALVTDLCWLGAIGAGAFTTYYYYKVYKPKKAAHERKLTGQAWLAPYLTGDQAGVALGGAF